MNFQQHSERLDEVKRVYFKIQRKEKLTPEEEELSLSEWPLSVRCSCCGALPVAF